MNFRAVEWISCVHHLYIEILRPKTGLRMTNVVGRIVGTP